MYTATFHNNNRYSFTGTINGKYEQGIIGTVAMLGFMSLKNNDHAVNGHNAATNKRILKDAIATRAAADVLLSSGTVVLMGTWSNGIQVGPGPAFVAIDHSIATKAALDKMSKPARKARGPVKGKRDVDMINPAWSIEDATCEMRYADGATCDMWGHYTDYYSTVRVCSPWQSDARKAANARFDAIIAASKPVYGPAYVAPLGTPPGIAIADDQAALHVWRSEMDFSYSGNEDSAIIAPAARQPMWLPTNDGSLVLNPAFEAMTIAHNAAKDALALALAADATYDECDDEITAMIDSLILVA